MRISKRIFFIYTALAVYCLFSLACLYTRHDIHVVLDIRHIQETASSIEDVVSGKKQLEELDIKDNVMLWKQGTQPFSLFAAAYADDDDEKNLEPKTLTPALKKAVEARKARFDEVKKFKKDGLIGEDNEAMLAITPDAKAKSPDAAQMKKAEELVKAENADRDTIYKEVAKQNKATKPEDLAKIKTAWARVHRKNSVSGDMIQLPSNPTEFDKFMQTDIGKKFTEKPKPGAWVKVP